MHARLLPGASVLLGAFLTAAPAIAGPPLLCHPFDIGSAHSLPWNDSTSWSEGRPGYDVRRLVTDTEALLTPATPALVRMETLRRAVLYASQDVTVARALLQRMNERAASADAAGHPDALAYLDAAYVTEGIHEVVELAQMSEFRDRAAALRGVAAPGAGYALIQKGLALTPEDAALHFAAALMAGTNRQAYAAHAAKARAGASTNALLTRNLQHISS